MKRYYVCKNISCTEYDIMKAGTAAACPVCGDAEGLAHIEKVNVKKVVLIAAAVVIAALAGVFIPGLLKNNEDTDEAEVQTAIVNYEMNKVALTSTISSASNEIVVQSEEPAEVYGKVWADGTTWEGKVDLNNMMYGFGVINWVVNGSTYTGQTKADMLCGYGRITYSDGNLYYVGQFEDNVKQGYGKIYYADGATFDGVWVADEHYYGICIWPNGIKYIGFFDTENPGARDGYGKEILPDGSIREGLWENNEFIGKKDINENQEYAKQVIIASYLETGYHYDAAAVQSWLADAGRAWNDMNDLLECHRKYLEDHTIEGFDEIDTRKDIMQIFSDNLGFGLKSEYQLRYLTNLVRTGVMSLQDITNDVKAFGVPE